MEGFQINYTDLSDLFWEYKRKIENLIENIDNCIERINMFTENAVFTGKTGNHSCCIISCHICGYLLRTGSGSH